MIGSVLIWIAAVALCLIAQTTVVPVIAIGDITPDLPAIILFMLAIKVGILPGIYAGFFLGMGQDLYSPAILGQTALAKTVMGFFAGLFNEKLMRTDPLIKLIILIIALLIHDTIFTAVIVVKTNAPWVLLVSELFTRSLPRALYSSVLVSLVYLWNYFVKPSFKR